MPRIHPIARAIIHHDGQILVLQNRDDHAHDWEAAAWELAGGFVDAHDENEEAALKREITEETGLSVMIEDALERVVVVEGADSFDCQYYLARAEDRDVRLSSEHQAYRWIDPGQFIELDWSRHAAYTIPIIDRVQDRIRRTD